MFITWPQFHGLSSHESPVAQWALNIRLLLGVLEFFLPKLSVTYWINIFLMYLLGLKFTITFLSLRMTFHCMEKNFLAINSFFVWRPAPIFKIWLYQHALGLMPKKTEFHSVDPLSIEGVSFFPGHLSLFPWKITQNNLNVLIISDFWAWLDWHNLWCNLTPYCLIIVRIQISLKAGKVSDKIKKLVNKNDL